MFLYDVDAPLALPRCDVDELPCAVSRVYRINHPFPFFSVSGQL